MLVGICDPAGLRQGFESHSLTDKGDVQVTVSGRQVRGGGNKALAQFQPADANGSGVHPGQTVTVTGHVSAGAYLYVRADNRNEDVYALGDAIFDRLGLENGGTATVRVTLQHDHLHYELTRADGTTGTPAATAGVGGPGASVAIPPPPAGYADSPDQLAHTYIAAVNARDGATICSLFTTTLQRRYTTPDEPMPCWAIVTSFIDFTGENADREFKNMLLRTIGARRTATVGTHHYVGLPLNLDIRFRRAVGASTVAHPQLRQTFDDVLWLEQQGDTSRIAKPSVALMAAGYIGRDRNEDPLAAPVTP